MLDMLSLAGDLIARTSSTARVQEIVQLSLAPVFLLAAIGALLNVVNSRLIWIVDRVNRIEGLAEDGRGGRLVEELPALRRRRGWAQGAVNLSASAALTICCVVALLFISAFIKPPLGTLVAVLWIVTMGLIIGALLLFLLETRAAIASPRDRRRTSRAILRGEPDQPAD